jgi:hypothetical protein
VCVCVCVCVCVFVRCAAESLSEGDASVDAVVMAGLALGCPLALFHEVLRVLRPGGTIHISYTVTEHTIAKTEERVSSDLIMGGFIDNDSTITTVRSKSSVTLRLAFSAVKPSYGGGGDGSNNGAQKLNFRRRKNAALSMPQKVPGRQQEAAAAAAAAASSSSSSRTPATASVLGAVKLSAMDLDEDDLVDEDALLELAPEAATVAEPRSGDDCEPGRGACKDCTCGRAEGRMVDDSGGGGGEAAASACGNCYLGDAFRCAGCPSKGLPPYEPGEKVKLPAVDMDADVDF